MDSGQYVMFGFLIIGGTIVGGIMLVRWLMTSAIRRATRIVLDELDLRSAAKSVKPQGE